MKNTKELKLRLKQINTILEQMGDMPQESDFIFDFSSKKPGDFISIKFNNNVQIIIKKIGDNLYEVVNNGQSIKLMEGDILRIEDSKKVSRGDEINMSIFRKIGMNYESSPVSGIN